MGEAERVPVSRRATMAALNPTTGEAEQVTIREARLRHLAKRGVGAILEADRTVRETLNDPEEIYEGLRSDDDEDRLDGDGWRCYCSRPNVRFEHATGRSYPPGLREIFLVFMNRDGVVYNWRWEPSDPNVSSKPREYEERFQRQVYP